MGLPIIFALVCVGNLQWRLWAMDCPPTLPGWVMDRFADMFVGGGHHHIRAAPYNETRRSVREVERRLGSWGRERHEPPEQLEQLFPDGSSYMLDGWGHPLHYEVLEGQPRVVSTGADGKPGGDCDDADLTFEVVWAPRLPSEASE